MDKLPLEILFHIFGYLPFSSYCLLYTLFPQSIIDAALVQKMLHDQEAIVHLVSTNPHELSSSMQHYQNESYLSLYFASYDPAHRYIWLWPRSFYDHSHYFKVKNAYVLHGKLVIKGLTTRTLLPLVSLWDIRKRFHTMSVSQIELLTIQQQDCILDACLIKSNSKRTIMDTTTTTTTEAIIKNDDTIDMMSFERPLLPAHYKRQIPMMTTTTTTAPLPSLLPPNHLKTKQIASTIVPVYPDPTCGFFLIERLGISIPTFLDLYK
ncbi:uncharacterized protein BX663DRAFT_525254 [Cokeromyces recurvatus]|uniref:uncharacterized protein n=1 Tax=Cokeromyces recurvatus TaxID=90255 RepID=UPI0022209A94|nr:uncharacterized protein BX663DRAFT_525254 [Cokeromyces recurvatus]KAI7898427.1 hypothetical protein BX663DRAFT_525254 [Cokeromyces recurvatus]